jgi:hypothetical protein
MQSCQCQAGASGWDMWVLCDGVRMWVVSSCYVETRDDVESDKAVLQTVTVLPVLQTGLAIKMLCETILRVLSPNSPHFSLLE